MKRLVSILLCCLMAAVAAPAYAGSISFNPTATEVSVGQQVSFQVIADGEGDPLVVSQFQLSYPPDLLTPISFTFAPGWTQTFDVGTDVMSGGTVVQAGGYTATFNGPQLVGTLTFEAQKTGVATIALSGDNTYLFEGDNGGNLFDGPLSRSQVTIMPSANGATSITAPVSSVSAAATSAPAAQTPSAFSFPPDLLWLGLGLVVLLLGVWWFYRRFKKRRSRKRRR